MSASKSGPRDAFVVIRHGDQTRVVDLPAGVAVKIGNGEEADVTVADPMLAGLQLSLARQKDGILLRSLAAGTFVGGKPVETSVMLGPGEELSAGSVLMVVGIVRPLNASGRRALTHHELRERLYEELARAGRGGRPTALVLLAGPNPGDGQKITTAALDTFRAGDVVATYAPDQVEFLLPDIEESVAKRVVARVLEGAGVEAQVGMALSPQHGESPERLIRAAREALAEAIRTESTFASPPPRVPRALDRSLLEASDPVTNELLAEVDQHAGGREPVLLIGERSAGKSAIARLLHVRGGRSGQFVTVACTMLEGSDADGVFDAKIAEASDGTLLLDEVGELDHRAQASLAARLENASEANVRLVSTTHRTLAGLVSRGGFDGDLYQRLNTVRLEVPPLRSRPDDILPLAETFARDAGNGQVRLSPGAVARLRSYPWPGNVLELSNAIARAVVLARDGEVLAEHLPSEPVTIASGEGRLREHVDAVERDSIIKALADCNHNQTHAAKRLGISRRALIYKMEKYGLKRPPKGARKR